MRRRVMLDFHGLGEVVNCSAGGFELNEQSKHLPAQGYLYEVRMVGPFGSEDLPEAFGLGLDSALAASTPEGCLDLGTGQTGGVGGGRSCFEQGEGFGPTEAVLPVRDSGQGRGVVLAQEGTELVANLLAVPSGVLLGSGEDGDGAGLVGVLGERSVSMPVRAEDVRQDKGVTKIGFLPGDGVAIPVSCGIQWIDRVDLPWLSPEDSDEQPAAGLDRDRNALPRAVLVLGKQVHQHLVAGCVVGDASLGQHLSTLVDQHDVVVILSPVDPAVDQGSLPGRLDVCAGHERMRATQRSNSRPRPQGPDRHLTSCS